MWDIASFAISLKRVLRSLKDDGDAFLNFDEIATFVKRDVSQLTDRAQQPTTIQTFLTRIVNIRHTATQGIDQ